MDARPALIGGPPTIPSDEAQWKGAWPLQACRLGLFVAALLAACSSGTALLSSATTTDASAPTAVSSTASVSATTSVSSTTSVPVSAQLSACRSSQLSASATPGAGAGGHAAFIIVVKNTSSTACNLDGYPKTAWFIGSGDTRLGATIDQVVAPSSGSVTVSAGQEASGTLWTDSPGVGAPSYCNPVTADALGIEVTPDLEPLTASISTTVCSTKQQHRDNAHRGGRRSGPFVPRPRLRGGTFHREPGRRGSTDLLADAASHVVRPPSPPLTWTFPQNTKDHQLWG